MGRQGATAKVPSASARCLESTESGEQVVPHEEVRSRRAERDPGQAHRQREHQGEPAAEWSRAGDEAVADAAHGLDQRRLLRIVLDLRPQPLHGRVDEARVAQVVVVPDQLEQQLARESPALAAARARAAAELGRRQLQLLAALPGGEPVRVDLEPGDADRGAVAHRRGPPQHRLHARTSSGSSNGLVT